MKQRPRRFTAYESRARALLRSPEKLLRLLRKAGAKLDRTTGAADRFDALRADLADLIDLLRAWAAGEYTGVSAGFVVTILAAVLYFVTPFDVVFDYIPVVGLLDDATVIAFALRSTRETLDAFRQWRGERPGTAGGAAEERRRTA